MSKWRTDRPEKHGYYIAAWIQYGQERVSELWFNPQAIGTGWFAARGYLGQGSDHSTQTLDVVAWQPIPAYPGGDDG